MKATLLLDSEPTQTQGDVLALTFAQTHYATDDFTWEISATVPEYLDVASADQLTAYAREYEDDARYMTITVEGA